MPEVVFAFRICRRAVIELRTITVPTPCVVPGALEPMREKKLLEIGANSQRIVLFAADSTIGSAFVLFGAGNARNRRIRAAIGTAHDFLQVAVAYLCHGVPPFLDVDGIYAADNFTSTFDPVASANRSSVFVLGSVVPLSSRAIVD
jgi:hypothetical protein